MADTLAAMMPPGLEPIALFRTLAHNPRILDKVRASNLLDRGDASERRDRELVILRTTARCGAEYEWGVHVAFFAARVGLSDDRGRGDRHRRRRRSGLGAARRAADPTEPMRCTTAPRSRTICGWSLPAEWSAAQLIELIVLAGFYHTVSFVVNAVGVEREAFAARFPRR